MKGNKIMQWTRKQLMKGKEIIQQGLERAGLDQYAFLAPEPEEASEQIQSIVVVLFPYYTGSEKGNLSMYCRGIDYHVVVPKYLKPVGEALKCELGEELKYGVYADTGPLRDRYLALRAGLGFVGRNQMMINQKYGSYCFIAYITLNLRLETDPQVNWSREIQCLNCGACVKNCPGGAMKEDGGFIMERCRSGITQKKGELEDWELDIFYKDDLIFGCDVCQKVCPHNKAVEVSPIKEFVEEHIDSLTMKDLEGLSKKSLQEKYPNRAFTWRGPEVLRRNLRLMEEKYGN